MEQYYIDLLCALINGIIIRTCAILSNPNYHNSIRQRCCVPERVLSEVSARGYDYLLFAKAFDLHAKTETMTILLRPFRCRSSSSVGQLAIQGSLESGASARAIFRTQVDKI